MEARYLMGTLVEIRLWAGQGEQTHEACKAAFAEIGRLQRLLSRFETTSELSRVNREAVDYPVQVSREFIEVVTVAQEVSRISGGAFDVTCGPWVSLWDEMAQEQRFPTCRQWRERKAKVGWEHIRMNPSEQTIQFGRPGVSLDLGAAGKGYAVDRAVAILQGFGIRSGLVDAGGNFKIFGFTELLSAGIEDPLHPDRLLATVDLIHPAIASSSQGRRFHKVQGVPYGHVVDPRTGWPTHACVGSTILAESALLADCVSTALLVLGPQGGKLIEILPVEGLFLKPLPFLQEELILWVSKGLQDHLCIAKSSEVYQ